MTRRPPDKRRGTPHAPAVSAGGDPHSPGITAIWIALAFLAAARAGMTFVPHMWAWSLNVQRFLDPRLGWALWGLAALVLVPAVARATGPFVTRVGDTLVQRPALAMGSAALAAALLVAVVPDRLRFVGDFLMRQGAVEMGEKPSVLFPQAFPLDVLLHYHLPRLMTDSGLFDPNSAGRALGMAGAAVLAAMSVAFPSAAGLGGAAAFATAAVLFFGGYLGMFTGYSKAFAEMTVLVAAAAVFGLRVVRDGRGLLSLGITLAIACALHRSGLGLLPAALFAWIVWFVRHGRDGAWRVPTHLIGIALPLVTLALMTPRIVAVVTRWDRGHFAPEDARAVGTLAAAMAGARPADLLNLIVMLSPLAVLVPILAIALARRLRDDSARRTEATFLALQAFPFLAVMPFIHPAQGLFRDWDDFAATGVAVSVIAAWQIGATLEGAKRASAIALAVALGVAAPTLQWLAHHADQDRGLQRVRAFMIEPPSRPDRLRSSTWDFIGIRNFRLERLDAAAEAFARAAEVSASPRILLEWGLTESLRGNIAVAQRIYRQMLEKSPEHRAGWLGLAAVSIRGGDYAEARRAARAMLALRPGDPAALDALREIARRESSLGSPAPPP